MDTASYRVTSIGRARVVVVATFANSAANAVFASVRRRTRVAVVARANGYNRRAAAFWLTSVRRAGVIVIADFAHADAFAVFASVSYGAAVSVAARRILQGRRVLTASTVVAAVGRAQIVVGAILRSASTNARLALVARCASAAVVAGLSGKAVQTPKLSVAFVAGADIAVVAKTDADGQMDTTLRFFA